MRVLLVLKLLIWSVLIARTLGGITKSYLESGEEMDSSEHGNKEGARSTSCPCGWTNKARIVGGKETLKNEFPLMVAMHHDEDGVFCGGSIITKNHVLTAAHCTYPYKKSKINAIMGVHNVQEGDGEEDTSVLIPVKYTVEHDDYVPKTYANDIALLILESPITFNQEIGPTCMPSTSAASLINEYIKVIGWGKLENKEKVSDVLMKVNLRVVPTDVCATHFPLVPIPTDDIKQVCTFRKGKDSCRGDSGGPLLWNDPETNRLTQVALVSFGLACARSKPAVNTHVFAYLDWIKEKIKESNLEGELCQKV